MSASHQESGSLQDLPEDLRDIADTISVETAEPDQQHRVISKTCAGVAKARTDSQKKVAVKLVKQVVEKVGQEGVDQVQEEIDGLLDEIDAELTPEFQGRLVNARLLHKAISFPPGAASVAIGKNAATREGMGKAVEAVAHLDEGKGVKRSQVQKYLGQSTTKVANLLKACVEAGAIRCAKSGPGSASLYHPIESKAPDPSSDPSSESEPLIALPTRKLTKPAIKQTSSRGSSLMLGPCPVGTYAPRVISNSNDTNINTNKSIKHIENRFAQNKTSGRNETLAKALRPHVGDNQADQILACGTPKEFTNDKGVTYPQEERCMHRLCALCANSRKARCFRDHGYHLDDGLDYMFITAVHANVDIITRGDVDGLYQSYRAFMLSKAMEWATGGIRSLEFGYGGQKVLPWRLHIHVLIPITKPFSNIREVKDEMHATWKKNNVDDLQISVKGNKYDHQRRLKYVGKGNDNPEIPAKQLEQLYQATEGRQLVNKFGSWLQPPSSKPNSEEESRC